MDVTSDSSVQQAIDTILSREGRLDAVINNAGIAIAGAIEDTSLDEARRQFEVNFFGVLRVCRAAIPHMRERRSGHIVNIGSIAGAIAVPYQGLYSASKFALEGLSESLRMELRDFGIRVVLIEPGDHCTSLTSNRTITASPHYPRFKRALARMEHDEQHGPQPENIAGLVQRILANPNPRFRYTAGPPLQRAAVWLKRLGPNALTEFAISKYYR
jgi:NAD(P)-dependent dehydrogenase (short-subunit alcohol dehydrogenase family)